MTIRRIAIVTIPVIMFSLSLAIARFIPAMAQTPTDTPTPTSTPTPDPLGLDLIGCWDMDETSGIRYDEVGSSDFTDNNTVGSAGGKISNAAEFIRANSEYLNVSDNPDLSISDIDFTWAAWFYIQDTSLSMLLQKLNEYRWYFHAGLIKWEVGSSGTALIEISQTTWTLAVGWHDATNNVVGLQLNNGTPSEISYSSGASDTANGVYVGRDWNGASYSQARIDVLAFWKRKLSAAQRTALYNGGAGKSCDDLVYVPPTPTPTSVFTATPTHSGEMRLYLESGDWATVDRTVTYGDIALFIAAGVILIVGLLFFFYRIGRSWIS